VLDIFLPALTTLFVVVDPLGLMPMFAVMTSGGDRAYRRSMAVRGTLIATVVLLLFAFAGEHILDFLGITISAFRIAGGLLLFVTAFEMIFEFRNKRRSHTAETAQKPIPEDISVFPLAIPLLSGPGAITSIILLTASQDGNWAGMALVIAALIIVMGVSFLLFLLSGRLMAALGPTITMVITRLLGVILAALATQFIIDGIKSAA